MKKSNEMYCLKFLDEKGKPLWMYIKTYRYINKKNVFIRTYPPVTFIKKERPIIRNCDIIVDTEHGRKFRIF